MKLRYIAAGLIILAVLGVFIQKKTASKIAVLKIDGIVLTSETYLQALKNIERDGSFKALVVRVDSPGGSVAASQEIHSHIKRLAEKMPVVASMGTVAASGGYYIACAAPVILANPGTITGSIGVIATFANYSELLRWAKVDFEVVKTGELKDAGSPLRPLSANERKYLQRITDGALAQFRDAVRSSRKISPEHLSEFLDGRVVLGRDAKSAGLVDEIGTLWDAVEIAAKKSAVKDPETEFFPAQKFSLAGLIMSGLAPEFFSSPLASSALRQSGIYYLSEHFGH